MAGATEERRIGLHRQHMNDMESATKFIDKTWPTSDSKEETVQTNSFITYAVSTALNCSLLLIAKRLETMFTRNTYSDDPLNPWLIFQHAKENQNLAQNIQNHWDKMSIQAEGSRTEVNTIAPHMLYQRKDRKGDDWELVPLHNNCVAGDNVVRFKVEDVEIWSHPPRDEALMAALTETPGFNQMRGHFLTYVDGWSNVRNNPNINIPADKKPGALENKRGKIRETFLKLYEFYDKLNPVPDSYKMPTLQLQLGQRNNTQRYGGTFAGVYGRNANEVHMTFPARNVKPRLLPSKAEVYSDLVASNLGLSFEDMMQMKPLKD